MHIDALSILLHRNHIESYWDDEMGDQLVDLDQNQHKLTNLYVRGHDVYSLAFGTDKIVVPIEIEAQYDSSKQKTQRVSQKNELNLFLPLLNVLIRHRFEELRTRQSLV